MNFQQKLVDPETQDVSIIDSNKMKKMMKQFLAVFTGSKTGTKSQQWNSLSETERNERITKGKTG